MSSVKEKEGSKTNRAVLFARLGNVVDLQRKNDTIREGAVMARFQDPAILQLSDPLEDYRTLLESGILVRLSDDGQVSNKLLMISSDYLSLLLKDIKSRKGSRINIKTISSITRGFGQGHFRQNLFGGTTSTAEENLSFVINCETPGSNRITNSYCLSMQTEEERERIYSAIERLLFVFRFAPQKLKRN